PRGACKSDRKRQALNTLRHDPMAYMRKNAALSDWSGLSARSAAARTPHQFASSTVSDEEPARTSRTRRSIAPRVTHENRTDKPRRLASESPKTVDQLLSAR